jgi:hypothetical protein
VAPSRLNPKFPVVDGEHRLTSEWSVTLSLPFNRRIEEGDLILWRPGLTAVFAIWNNDRGESQAERLSWLVGESSPDAYDLIREEGPGVSRFAYRLAEESADDRVAALYAFTIADHSHVQLAVYFDDDADLSAALALWRSVRTP